MPILDIQIVGPKNPEPGLARKVADAAGEIFGCRAQGCWVKLQLLPESQYAENGGSEEGFPVFVSVLEAAPPAGKELEKLVGELASVIAKVTGRDAGNVHIVMEPAAAGRIAFGGQLKT